MNKTTNKKVIILVFVIILAFTVIFGLFIAVKNTYYDIRFPLADVCSDNADYVLIKYGTDGIYVIDNDKFLLSHRYDTFIYISIMARKLYRGRIFYGDKKWRGNLYM